MCSSVRNGLLHQTAEAPKILTLPEGGLFERYVDAFHSEGIPNKRGNAPFAMISVLALMGHSVEKDLVTVQCTMYQL